MIHGDARHVHRASAIGPKKANVLWTVKVAGPVQAQVVPSPDESRLYVASLDKHLHALAAGDGKEAWSLDLGERAYATPLVGDDGTIYAGSDAKKLLAIAPDGSVKWRLETDGEIDTGIARASEQAMVVSSGRDVLCVRKNGDVLWRFSATGKVFTSPAITSDGLIVFGSQDHRAYGVDARGRKVFAIDLGADVDGSPAIGDDGAIYVGTDNGEVVRLDGHGSVVWSTPVGGFVRGVLSIARNGDILAGVYGPAPRQVRIAPDGRIRGSFPIQGTGAKEHGVHGGALEDAAGTLFFGAQDDGVHAVASTGELLFRFAAEADVDAPMTLLSDGSLVFAVDDGSVYHLAP
jgi:outer membrane protein assembly factor BamB